MPTRMLQSTRAAGLWSAVLAAVFSLVYVVGQLAEWMGWLGSAGGPQASSTALGIFVLLTPSLLLGSSFLLLLVALHQVTPPARRIWSQAALVFGTVYAVLISMNYFVQLEFVAPHIARGDTLAVAVAPFLFTPFDSFFYAVDLLGYSFMSVATLFAAFVFAGGGIERNARWLLLANGLLLPFLALQIYFHFLIWPASLWAVTFPGSMIALGLYFHRAEAVTDLPVAERDVAQV